MRKISYEDTAAALMPFVGQITMLTYLTYSAQCALHGVLESAIFTEIDDGSEVLGIFFQTHDSEPPFKPRERQQFYIFKRGFLRAEVSVNQVILKIVTNDGLLELNNMTVMLENIENNN